MAKSVDEAKLKELLKSAVAEVLEERREVIKEIIEEAMEDVALARAIGEGLSIEAVRARKCLPFWDPLSEESVPRKLQKGLEGSAKFLF